MKEKSVITKKRKEEIILPGERYIFQSNRVTTARFPDFNIYHTKIFVCLIKQLQEAIQADMDGKNWQQLGLFEEAGANTLRIGIPLSEIADKKRYQDVISCFHLFKRIDFKIQSLYSKDHILHTSLVEKFEEPKKFEKNPTVFIHIQKQIAHDLVMVAKNSDTKKPIQFTRFLYDVVMNAKNKYTWKIYTLISSWRSKGGFSITLEQFRFMLGLSENEYRNYSDLKRFVIVPVQKELDHKADCWFNCADKDFETKEGKRVVGLRFKVITPEVEGVAELKKEQAQNILRTHAGFKQIDFKAISDIFYPSADYGAILVKILELINYTEQNKGEINSPTKYIVSSLLKEYAPKGEKR